MSAAAKKVVRNFLDSDVFVDPEDFSSHFHKDFKMHWHASSGYREFNYEDYERFTQAISVAYESMRSEITHMISDKDEVAARFTVFVRTVENPREEVPVGYFISIFKVSENKIIEVHQTSHPSEG
ncbi:nuclear transport factor 2 family protein [Nonlabens sp.]|uniref:nuclear transport factor 2 family protein n=1 Tax=Nonlabens sp. TaxID=1888209 RepID=UPI003F69B5F5